MIDFVDELGPLLQEHPAAVGQVQCTHTAPFLIPYRCSLYMYTCNAGNFEAGCIKNERYKT